VHNDNIVGVGNTLAGKTDKAVLREIHGSLLEMIDHRFAIILFLSLLVHSIILFHVSTIELKEVETTAIEKMSERIARLIVEKPVPKEKVQKKQSNKKTTKTNDVEKAEKETPKTASAEKAMDRKIAKKAVARRAARVEKKIRTVGVLGMLTGVGSTAKGPSVVDILGDDHNKKERFQDLEKALENMSGLQQTKDINILQRKIVRSKDLSINYKENIDNLVASIGTAKTTTFSKKGNFVIQRPESIEGAASSNEKRNNAAINKIVSSHKVSIRMSYEKYLNRIPDLAGKIIIRFTISVTGRVTSIKIVENTTNNQDLEKDIVRKMKMWRFEEVTEGDVTVTYPFVFRPS
jgi:TonB family protein